MEIRYWNRIHQREEVEQVYGAAWVNWLYGTWIGRLLADWVFVRKPVSAVMGWYYSSSWSRKKILGFIRDFRIPMDQYVEEEGGFRNFNEFFIRRFRPGAREVTSRSHELAAPAEARYVGYRAIDSGVRYPVKGQHLTAAEILGPEAAHWSSRLEGGPMLIARLCPVDYHRFHFPADGQILEETRIPGVLHSVNPAALRARPDVFCVNERHLTILETPEFGVLAYLEVGAMGVGRIVQTHSSQQALRGAEKGYFLFGASTVVLMGEPGRWEPSADLLENTQRKQMETWVPLGQCVGQTLTES